MKRGKAVLLVGLLLTVGAGFLFLPVREWLTHLEGYVKSLGSIGPIAVAAAYVFTTVLLIPGSAITIAAGGLFGLKTGFLVVLVGANLGAFCSFLLARTFLRDKAARWAENNSRFRSLDRAIGREGFKVVFLSRLSPIFPFTLLNYFLGLTAVRTGSYTVATLFGMLPGIFLYVYIGAAARDALTGQIGASAGGLQQLLKVLGLVATIAVVVLVTRIARRALREAEPSEGVDLAAPAPPLKASHKPTTIHPYPTQAEALRKTGDAHMGQRLTPVMKKILQKWFIWRR